MCYIAAVPYIRVPKLSGSHPLVVADAVQVRLHWSYNGVLGFNVLGGRVAGGFGNSQAHADALAVDVAAGLTSSGLAALLAASTELVAVGIRDVRNPNLVEYIGDAGPLAGGGAGDALPNQLAAVVTLRTQFAGKHFRGRVYFGGANEAQNDSDGHIAGAFNTAIIAFMDEVESAMGTQGITLAVLSRPNFLNLAPPADIQTYAGGIEPVTAKQARDVLWDTQRRRKT